MGMKKLTVFLVLTVLVLGLAFCLVGGKIQGGNKK